METEVHVYAFSIAVNVLLAFFPFLIVMVSLCHYILHWKGAEAAIFLALQDYFPEPLGGFIQRNLRSTVERQGPLQFVSIFLLFFTANGIFEPLEVALNKAWGVTKNRTFLKNQLVSLGLIFACGGLVLISTVLTAVNRDALSQITGASARITLVASLAFFKAAALPMSILMLFLIYWILPNRKLRPSTVIPAAILVGITLELLKYLNALTWPWLRVKLEREYGPFAYSVTIILWSFLAAMIILAGAEWSARRRSAEPISEPPA
jgi:YihY family inner membrane protein